MARLDPHPYALMLPPLTDEEYAALKDDIAEHGILYPVIADEDELVLDGVHRVKIADELGIEPPVSQMGQLSEERKMHLAVGLNMRRRHLDVDRRRELVRRLAEEQGLSVRKIASVTGWSKSTVDRDLRTSPLEELLFNLSGGLGRLRRFSDSLENEAARELFGSVADQYGVLRDFIGWMDGQWKRGTWPPPPEPHVELTFAVVNMQTVLSGLMDVLDTAVKTKGDKQAMHDARRQTEQTLKQREKTLRNWRALPPDERVRKAAEAQERGVLFGPVPDGTPQEDDAP
jgi:transcriptional regulator with XRE-family HTH domain